MDLVRFTNEIGCTCFLDIDSITGAVYYPKAKTLNYTLRGDNNTDLEDPERSYKLTGRYAARVVQALIYKSRILPNANAKPQS